MPTTPNAIIPGSRVTHPSRGTGTVSTVIYSYLWRRPTEAEVDFERIGKRRVRIGDLTLVEQERPALRVVEPVVA